jgi:hypothetical protein
MKIALISLLALLSLNSFASIEIGPNGKKIEIAITGQDALKLSNSLVLLHRGGDYDTHGGKNIICLTHGNNVSKAMCMMMISNEGDALNIADLEPEFL